ncbi:MAG: DNA-processing protein DprA [Flavobacteriaceae bacterium]|nr:DNA-processing protein DprA [Flavobacteriaceae bacterium]
MHSDELKYLMALSYVPKLGAKRIRDLMQHFGTAANIWNLTQKEKNAIQGLNKAVSNGIGKEEYLELVDSELNFCNAHQVSVSSLYDDDYPYLLQQCIDAPLILFQRGNMNLKDGKFIAIVGTRKMTSRGKDFIKELIGGFHNQPVSIVSGLAFGVDAQAHLSSIENNLQTIGVLAHGVNQIFPKTNASIGYKMMNNGGILSEFSTFHAPEPENFLRRNRIIAGLCEATIVVESGLAGGAMSTARHANNYNRDVFAVPGRPTDHSAKGCHHLIKNHQAFLLTEAEDVLKFLNISQKKKKNIQKELFVELSEPEQKLYDLLKRKGKLHIDFLALELGMAGYQLMPVLLDLELKNLIEPLPGKYFDLA